MAFFFKASKEYVDALDEKQREVVRGIAKTVELQGTNIARLTGRADGLQRLITELTDKVVSWGKITSENTCKIGELIDAVSKLSADLTELDKRVGQLSDHEHYQTLNPSRNGVFEAMNITAKKFPAARGVRYEIGDVTDATEQKPRRHNERRPWRSRYATWAKQATEDDWKIHYKALTARDREGTKFNETLVNCAFAVGLLDWARKHSTAPIPAAAWYTQSEGNKRYKVTIPDFVFPDFDHVNFGLPSAGYRNQAVKQWPQLVEFVRDEIAKAKGAQP